MKLQEALAAAWAYERDCRKVIKTENERWNIPDTEIDELKGIEEYFEYALEGMFAVYYLNRLIEAGVVGSDGTDISELEAVPGFKDGKFRLPSSG
jgi:hypothetical protein